MFKIKEIPDECLQRFEYDSNSPSGLVYKTDIYAKNGKLRLKKGSAAGCIIKRKNGKHQGWQVSISNLKFPCHRIVWFILRGKPDTSLVIDHLDGNPLNNAIENLRLVQCRDNNCNSARAEVFKDNFLPNGIIFREVLNGSRNGYNAYFIVHWQENNFCKSKHFSVNKFGIIKAQYLAVKFRKSKESNLTERHGK